MLLSNSAPLGWSIELFKSAQVSFIEYTTYRPYGGLMYGEDVNIMDHKQYVHFWGK